MSALDRSSPLAAGALLVLLAVGPAARAESYLGINAKSNSNVLEQSNAFAGITVTSVVENSPGEAAGIREGDVLLRANGVELSHPDRLKDLASKLAPGERVRLRLERDRAVLERVLTTAPRLQVPPDSAPARASGQAPPSEVRIERRRLGIEFRSAAPARLVALGLQASGGVEVTALASRSPLLIAGVRPGDVIFRLDRQTVPSADELLAFLADLKETRDLQVELYDTAGQRRLLSVTTYRPDPKLTRLSLPPLLSIERKQDSASYSFLLGLVRVERFETSSRYRLLYLLRFETGSPDLLEPERE